MTLDPAKINRFIVQEYDEKSGKWLSINDRIFVRDKMKPGVTQLVAVDRARADADRQVSGWQAGYPLRQYRATAAE